MYCGDRVEINRTRSTVPKCVDVNCVLGDIGFLPNCIADMNGYRIHAELGEGWFTRKLMIGNLRKLFKYKHSKYGYRARSIYK
jgi:hypothetical protein